jgi:hypothetical protein
MAVGDLATSLEIRRPPPPLPGRQRLGADFSTSCALAGSTRGKSPSPLRGDAWASVCSRLQPVSRLPHSGQVFAPTASAVMASQS